MIALDLLLYLLIALAVLYVADFILVKLAEDALIKKIEEDGEEL